MSESQLSPREHQILAGIRKGMPYKAIAASLFVTTDTIKSHTRDLFRKLGVHDRAEAVAVAYETGIFTSRATNSDGCCHHCRAIMAVLCDGQGEKGMVKRIQEALKKARIGKMKPETSTNEA